MFRAIVINLIGLIDIIATMHFIVLMRANLDSMVEAGRIVHAFSELLTVLVILQGEWRLIKKVQNGITDNYEDMIIKNRLGDKCYSKLGIIGNNLYSGIGDVDYSKSGTWGGCIRIEKRNDGFYNIDIRYFLEGPFAKAEGHGIIDVKEGRLRMAVTNGPRPVHIDPLKGDNTDIRYYSK